jgi:hypothetical protein
MRALGCFTAKHAIVWCSEMRRRMRTVCSSSLLTLIAVVLFLSPHDSQAFLREYRDYAITSNNGHFVGEVNFSQGKVLVYEVENDKRTHKWSANLFTPIAETVYLSDDGQSVVLEDYYSNVLCFFHKGKNVRRYTAKQIFPAKPVLGESRGDARGFGDKYWNQGNKLAFLSTFYGEPCYCVWFVGETSWLSWTLKDGERVNASPPQQRLWFAQARRLAENTLTDMGSRFSMPMKGQVVKAKPQPRRQTPGFQANLRFLARDRTVESRKFLEGYLGTKLYMVHSSKGGATIEYEAGSYWRRMADLILAEFDGKVAKDPFGFPSWFESMIYLGGVSGVVDFPAVPSMTNAIILVETANHGTGWPKTFPPERISVDFEDVAKMMDQKIEDFTHKRRRVRFSFRDLPAGDYRVKVLLIGQKNPRPITDAEAILTAAGDWYGETPPFIILPGIIFESDLISCNREL